MTGTIVNTGEEAYGIYADSYGISDSITSGSAGSVTINVSGVVQTTGIGCYGAALRGRRNRQLAKSNRVAVDPTEENLQRASRFRF